ncbi:hypothetical protein SARC_04009 [Sphaeroforma arctica JP610]|uniref:Nucleolar protein 14 n=1 Tax=Sphaeroforma arctica JP610 TaxID=667725 RepID=A0A0L0G4E3_9EUKA|nr:hypothetical protein SARC_04009 [Sphaeroforma arctica JP610]KNC83759.1 hypothetical protein SARC_04009 [Sphaeroforma arctica JP610]|eukprot:XP_014157661.1 hypothetical protein SARC_04009 [Sphaeroforma arctica JP610]
MLKRFAVERQKRREKSAVYNLGDDGAGVGGSLGNHTTMSEDEEEEMFLTHGGRSLAEIDDFDERDLRLSDDEEVDGDTRYNTELHFGGFEKESERKPGDKPLTRKEIMMEVVKKSKLYKMERQNEKIENLEKIEELDDYLGEIMKEGRLHVHTDDTREAEKKVNRVDRDDYDLSVRALAYELKAKATDRLKTDEEIATEALEELRTLEANRLRRMRGEAVQVDSKSVKKHTTQSAAAAALALQSVEDLDGNLMLDKDENEVYYENGQMMYKGKEVDLSKGLPSAYGGEGVTSSEEEGEGSAESEAEDCADESGGESDEEQATSGQANGERGSDEEEGSSEGESEMDSDVADSGDSGDDEPKAKTKKRPAPLTAKQRKEIAAAAAKELPYTYKMPEDIEGFAGLLADHTATDILTIISRLRSCYHVSLTATNREALGTLFGFVVQYAMAVAGGDIDPAVDADSDGDMEAQVVALLDGLSLCLYEMAVITPTAACEAFRHHLKQATDYLTSVGKKGKGGTSSRKRVILGPILYLLRLVMLLFPVSDLQHPVTTGAAMLMSQILTVVVPRNQSDLSSQLFCASMLGQFVAESHRFVPAAVNFITGVVGGFALGNDWSTELPSPEVESIVDNKPGEAEAEAEVEAPKKTSSKKRIRAQQSSAKADGNSAQQSVEQPSAKRCGVCARSYYAMLHPTAAKVPGLLKMDDIDTCQELEIQKMAFRDLLVLGDDDGSFSTDGVRLNTLSAAVDLLAHFTTIYSTYKCFDSLFQPAAHHLKHIIEHTQTLPADLKNRAISLDAALTKETANCVMNRAHLMLQKFKPVALRQFNPKFEDRYMHGMSFDPDKDRRERKKLKYLHKQELKGAKRELKQDAQFIARQKLKDKMEADEDRSQKVKRLYGILQDSQAEGNSLKRMKK